MPRVKRKSLVVAVPLVVLLAAGCGKDDKKSSEASKPKTLTVTASGAGKEAKLSVPAGAETGVTEIRFQNQAKSPLDAQFVRVEGDHTAEEVAKVTSEEGAPIPSWLAGGGGVGQVAPGKTGAVTEQLAEGRYVVTSSSEGGKPASAEVTVKAGEGGGQLPKAGAKIEAKDYSFTTTGLKAGSQKVEFANTGKELHHTIGFAVKPGKTPADLKKFFESEGEPEGPPPFDEKGMFGTAVIDGGQRQVIDLDLKSGKYAFVCFIQDRKGGPPHVAKGMLSEVTVP